MPAQSDDTVGVIKGRFQTPRLHKGHLFTIREVRKRHKHVLIIVGSTYQSTIRDPMPFILIKMMLESLFPGVVVIEDPSNPKSYKRRSDELTQLIRATFPGRDAIIYGARDSIVHTYKGLFPVKLVKTVYAGSATQVRGSITYRNHQYFREGYTKAVMDHKAVFYPAVDVAIVNPNMDEVLLIGLNEEDGKLRFPGVFFDPAVDDTYEDAAMRCIKKEVGKLTVSSLQFIGSRKIDDWRYRKTNDGVVSILMRCVYSRGNPTPGNGIEKVRWVRFEEVRRIMAPSHRPLAKAMSNRWFG